MWCVTGAASSARASHSPECFAFSEALAAIRALTGNRRPSAWKRAGTASDPPGRSVAHPARAPRTRQARCARDPHRAAGATRGALRLRRWTAAEGPRLERPATSSGRGEGAAWELEHRLVGHGVRRDGGRGINYLSLRTQKFSGQLQSAK